MIFEFVLKRVFVPPVFNQLRYFKTKPNAGRVNLGSSCSPFFPFTNGKNDETPILLVTI